MKLTLVSILLAVSQGLALQPGKSIPDDLSAKNQDGKIIHFSKFRGHHVLVYFYPKDNTPGCTVEAETLQNNLGKFQKLNAHVLGVSRQDENSHRKFIAKLGLKFDLLVDEDGKLGKALGVGTVPILGLSKRQSVLIAPDGRIAKIYETVNPKTHAEEVLKDIEVAQAEK